MLQREIEQALAIRETGRAWVAARKDWYGASNVRRRERYDELMRCERELQKAIENDAGICP